MIKIFLVIFFGYFLSKKGIISADFEASLSRFLVMFVLPIGILSTSNFPLNPALSSKMSSAALITLAYYSIAGMTALLIARCVKVGEHTKRVFITSAVFGNCVYIGLPILRDLFGSEAVLYGIIFVLGYQAFFFSFGTAILSGEKHFSWARMFKDPTLIASIVTVIIFFSPFRFPKGIADSIDTIGSMMTPLSLIIIGCKLAYTKIGVVFTDRLAYLTSALKLIVMPLLLWLLMIPFQLDPLMMIAFVICAALPVGAQNVIVAAKYHGDTRFAVVAVSQSTLLMAFTIPLFVFALTHLYAL